MRNSSKTREFAFHQMKNLRNTTRTKGSTLYTVKQSTITVFRVPKTKELSFHDETTNRNLQSQSRGLPSHVGRRHFKALLDLLLTTIKILSQFYIYFIHSEICFASFRETWLLITYTISTYNR